MSSNTFVPTVELTLHRLAVIAALALALLLSAGALPAFAQQPLKITTQDSTVLVTSADRPVLEYQFVPKPKKPYVRQLFSPAGVQVLRDAPHDHLHHHALMFAVAVDGVDFWSEHDKCGDQKHRSLADVTTYSRDGLSWAAFRQQIDWTAPGTGKTVLNESRRIDVCRMPEAGATVLSWQCRLSTPPDKPSVTLTGSTYFGLGVRFLQSMDAGGEFQNADGKTGVDATNDVRSAWCAYSASADGKPVTIAIFDSPANPRHPATWFTMDSGFAYLAATVNLSKQPLVIKSAKPLELKYAVALFDGQVEKQQIDKLYRQLLDKFSEAEKP